MSTIEPKERNSYNADLWREIKTLSIVIALAAISLFACPSISSAQTTTQISQYGITWTFNRAVQYGQFANGDYWVVGPVTITRKTPVPQTVGGFYINGSMVNPWANVQAYDGRSSNYRNDLAISFPYNMSPGESLVSSISVLPIDFSEWNSYSRGRITDAAVLTCLSAPPPAGSFRPPYAGYDKRIYNVNQLYDFFLGQMPLVSGAPRLHQQAGDEQYNDTEGSLAQTSVERLFERPWIDHASNWMAQEIHPWHNMRDYGREISTQVGIGAVMLNSNFTSAEKRILLIRMVQIGIDTYGVVNGVGGVDVFYAAGGHSGYRKFFLFLAAMALQSPEMKAVLARSGDYLYINGPDPTTGPSDYIHFGADDQTFYVKQSDIDATNGPDFSPDDRDAQKIPYNTGDLGQPEWGIVHYGGPNRSNRYWDTAYRRTTANSWAGWILAAQAMGLRSEWNHNVLFDYQDRYMQVTGGVWPGFRQTDRWIENMWDAHRNSFGCTWTMDNPNDAYSQGYYECGGARVTCAGQNSTCSNCTRVTSCAAYPNTRANDYDPCRLGCSGGGPQILYGDVSENGTVSAYDAALTAQYVVGLIQLSPSQLLAADVTGNGSVSATDASWIARKVIDPSVQFPVE